MLITVVGIGAMGSIYAAYLARAGHRVTAIDPWTEHLRKVKKSGLLIKGFSKNLLVKGINTQSPSDPLQETELFVIATKTTSLRTVGKFIAPMADKLGVPIVTIQNGLGASDLLNNSIRSKKIIIGAAEGFGAQLEEPGVVNHTAMKRIRLGAIDSKYHKDLKTIILVFQSAGLPTEQCDSIRTLKWEKFILNVSLSAPCALADINVKELMDCPQLWKVALECGREAFKVAKFKGIDISYNDPEPVITEFAKGVGTARPSMALDFSNHRLCEIDSINGRVKEEAASTNVETPVNDLLTALIKNIESLRKSKSGANRLWW